MTIAQTILNQLGGNKFLVMTGAKTLVSHEHGLSFRLPANFAKNKINCVKITLDSNDLYTVEFIYIRGINMTAVAVHDDIYADMLQELFTSVTGLDTHL